MVSNVCSHLIIRSRTAITLDELAEEVARALAGAMQAAEAERNNFILA